MDMEKILQTLDRLFATYQLDQVEGFLENHINEAVADGDVNAQITLLNELIGYLRDTGKFEKCVSYCERLHALVKESDLQGTVPYATTLINIANAYRAAGKLDESLVLFKSAEMMLDGLLARNHPLFASLYNNMALLYQEAKDFEASCECLERALLIVQNYDDKRIETATTHTNLAMSLLKLGKWEEAMAHLKPAFSIFEMDEEKNFHYSGALSAMGEALYLAGRYEESAAYYEKALHYIEKNTGKSAAYEIVAQNLEAARYKAKEVPDVMHSVTNGLSLCEAFYHEFGEPMLRSEFPAYYPYMACGLVGEGSECLGFDDEISRDHDFGPGFCIWLTDSDYDEIGEKLQEAYDKLPKTYMGVTRYTSEKAPKRVGVFRISDFYNRLIGLSDAPESLQQWLYLDDYRLRNATDGKVFYDALGAFSGIRGKMKAYYPEEARIRKVARQAALIAQAGQYNYGRMLERRDFVTAGIALSEFMKDTMLMVHLLNRKYAPYYKWLRRSMDDLPLLSSVRDILDAIATMQVGDPRIPECIEMVVKLIIEEMQKQSLTTRDDTYLDHHTDSILHAITKKDENDLSVHSAFVDELIALEWAAFDKTQNIGGRAGCQDDYTTFSIMRRSQYLTWSVAMLKSYIQDFHRAEKEGRNLISEKYGQMMASTSPLEYAKIKHMLPTVSEEKMAIIDAICAVQVGMMEECAEKYPKAALNARVIHTTEDTMFSTSYETYLRGELMTYSDETLELYGRFIAEIAKQGQNLAQMIIENTAVLYGYASLDDLEKKL